MRRVIDGIAVKFLIVGAVNTLVGGGVMFLLYNLVHCSYWVSSAANYVVGGLVSFFLNKHFTFQNRERSWKQPVKFAAVVAVCYLLGYGLAKPLVAMVLAGQTVSLRENGAMLVGMCLYTVLNYLGQRFIAFK